MPRYEFGELKAPSYHSHYSIKLKYVVKQSPPKVIWKNFVKFEFQNNVKQIMAYQCN